MRKRTNRHPSPTATPVSTRESSCSKVSIFDAAPPAAPIKYNPFDLSLPDRPVYRSPLAIVLNEGNKGRRQIKDLDFKRASSPSMVGHTSVEAEELWKLLPSSPPACSTLSYSKYDSSPTLDWLYNSKSVTVFPRSPHGAQKRMYPGSGEKRTQVLEWACARLEKRRKLCEDHVNQDDSSGSDTTEDIYSDNTLPLQPRSQTVDGQTKNTSSGTPHVCIPPEYRALFSPDIILGASLLLTLKHSIEHE